MPTIVPAYTYTDNAALNVSGHNLNLFSTTSAEGAYSEANGWLDANNRDPSFLIQDYHVWPEEAMRVRGDNNRQTVDYFSDFESGPDVVEDNVREELANVAGCGLRFYLPYSSDVLFTAGFFVSIWRPHIASSDQEVNTDIDLGDVRVQLTMDLPAGSGGSSGTISHSKRGLPVSVRLNQFNDTLLQIEQVACFYFNLHHFERDVTKGFVDFHLRLLVKQDGLETHDVFTPIPRDDSVGGARDITIGHNLFVRVTFGIRNPCALVFGG